MKIRTGIPGFDDVLNGGIERGWVYLVKGGPGSGKTIFGLQFLMEGALKGEKCLYISFEQSAEELKLQADTFGWDIENPNFIYVDRTMKNGDLPEYFDYSSFGEIHEFISSITSVKELPEASRVFIDGIGVLRDFTKDSSIYRRIVSSIINFLTQNGITTIISEEMRDEPEKGMISYLTSGEFILEKKEREDGEIFRTISVVKYRGGKVHLGRHYFDITERGIVIWPIVRFFDGYKNSRELISTGDENLDSLLGGGILRGAEVMLAGKSGVGKTNLTLQILMENDRRKETGIIYAFEENEDEIKIRYSELFGYSPSSVIVRETSPYGMNIGHFYNMVIRDVEKISPSIIAIDPINALEKMSFSRSELFRVLQLLCSQLKNLGIIFIQIYESAEAMDVFQFTGGISYFSDYIIIGRHMELEGEIIKTLSVLKNRFGDHERSIRVLELEKGKGLMIGPPLRDIGGLISGTIERKPE